MIAFLEGTVAFKNACSACLNVNGVGYLLLMPQRSIAALPEIGQSAHVLCKLIVNDTGAYLFGFTSDEERDMFDELVQISGIGPKTALAALSCMTPSEIILSVSSQDVKAISKIPGIGKKSASRIVLELKDKFPQVDAEGSLFASSDGAPSAFDPVREALSSMGFTGDEIEFACKDADPSMSEQELLKHALKRLA